MIFSQFGYVVENISPIVILGPVFIFTSYAKVSATSSATKARFTKLNSHLLQQNLLLESSPGSSMKRALHELVLNTLPTIAIIFV
jgi:hypothetical protein